MTDWNQNRELEHQSDVEYLRALEGQRKDLDTEIKKYRDKIDLGGSLRSEAFHARQKQREIDAVAEAKRTGKSVVYTDPEDGCEVTASPNGHTFYNMADWY